MAEWQYARVIITYQGERITVEESWLGFRREEVLVHDWTVEWYDGGGGQPSVEQHSGSGVSHIGLLNSLGQVGWEVAAALQYSDLPRFDYVLKRPVPGDGDGVTAADVEALHDELTTIRTGVQEMNALLLALNEPDNGYDDE